VQITDPQSLQGRTAHGTDGKLGTVEGVYVDQETGNAEWATVATGLFGRRVSFVPLATATSTPDGDLQLPFDKAAVKNAPHHEPDQELTVDEERQLFEHYGVPYGGETATALTDGPSAGTEQSRAASTDAGTAAGAGAGAGVEQDARDTTSQGTVGHDTSGPTTDQAMTRSEEQLRVGTQQTEAGRARLRKYVVTENVTQTVPVSHEEVRVEREPITDANRPAAHDGPAISEEEHEVVLHAEQPVVQKEAVPVERVKLDTETVTEQQQVSEQVRKEQIETDGDVYPGGEAGRTERDRTR
jgi:uncharacterized protein (TIGR02271 family)